MVFPHLPFLNIQYKNHQVGPRKIGINTNMWVARTCCGSRCQGWGGVRGVGSAGMKREKTRLNPDVLDWKLKVGMTLVFLNR